MNLDLDPVATNTSFLVQSAEKYDLLLAAASWQLHDQKVTYPLQRKSPLLCSLPADRYFSLFVFAAILPTIPCFTSPHLTNVHFSVPNLYVRTGSANSNIGEVDVIFRTAGAGERFREGDLT
jgi:hypothetical protein